MVLEKLAGDLHGGKKPSDITTKLISSELKFKCKK